MKRLGCVLIFVLCCHAYAGQNVEIKNGFVMGKAYLDLTPREKRLYAMGIVDGMLLSPFFSAPKRETYWIENCVTGMSDEQVAALLTKFLNDHPERWHLSVHTAMWTAMKAACPKEAK